MEKTKTLDFDNYNKEIDYSDIDPQKSCNSPRELFKHIINKNIQNKLCNTNTNYYNICSNSLNNKFKDKELKENKDKDIKESKDIKDFKDEQSNTENKNDELLSKKIANVPVSNIISSKNVEDQFLFLEHISESYLDFVNESYFSVNDNTKVNNDLNLNEEDSDVKNDNKFKFTSLDLLMNPLRSHFPFEKWSPYEIALFQACICKYGKDFELFKEIIKTKSIGEIQEFFLIWEKSKYYSAWVTTQIKRGKFPNKLF
jgi:hypothetical protein